jgi:hypothetical protein
MAVAPLVASPALAQSATQLITLEIRPISRLAVSGTTAFTLPATRSAKASVLTASATYAVTTNEENRRIMVALDGELPKGVSLRMRMAAPAGAHANEEVTLTTEPKPAVVGISRFNGNALGIEYSLITAEGAVISANTTRTVKVTLVTGV